MRRDGTEIKDKKLSKQQAPIIKDEQFIKLKSEINSLVARISQKERKENEFLKARIRILESENLRLKNLLYKDGMDHKSLGYFAFNKNEELPN
jgi:hypothetical protein